MNDIQTQTEVTSMRKSAMEQMLEVLNRIEDIMKDVRADKYNYAQLSKLTQNLELSLNMLKEDQ